MVTSPAFQRFEAAVEALPPIDHDKFRETWKTLFVNQVNFCRVWDAITVESKNRYVNFIHAGMSYFVLEAGLVKIGALRNAMLNLDSVYTTNLIYQMRGPIQPTYQITGGLTQGMLFTFVLNKGTVVASWLTLSAVADSIAKLIRKLMKTNSCIAEYSGNLDHFARSLEPAKLLLQNQPMINQIAASACSTVLIEVVADVTNVRLCFDFSTTKDSNLFNLQLNPSWGETALLWQFCDYRPRSWDPLPHQSTSDVSTHPLNPNMRILIWNVNGAFNPDFLPYAVRVKDKANAKVIIFTDVEGPTDILPGLMSLLKFNSKFKAERNAFHKGVWLVWNSTEIKNVFQHKSEARLEAVFRVD